MITKGLAGQPDRIYAVGDVHGHCDRLRELHEAIRQDLRAHPVDHVLLVHLGDYIDRGPNSAGCLSLLAGPAPLAGMPTVNLMGNHERMLLDAIETPRRAELWRRNGGDTTLASWKIAADTPSARWRDLIPADHLQFLDGLSVSHEAGQYLFVHAGVRPGIRLALQDPQDLLWIRDDFLDWDGKMLPEAPERVIVHGHTPASEPELRHNRIGIDTNAGRGGKLTCAVLGKNSVYFLQV